MHAFFIARYNVGEAIVIHIFYHHVQAHARIVVYLVGNPSRICAWLKLKPNQQSRFKLAWVAAIVGKIAFACYQIGLPVAVDVGQSQAVGLRKCLCNFVLRPSGFARLVFALLVLPNAVAVGRGGYDVF